MKDRPVVMALTRMQYAAKIWVSFAPGIITVDTARIGRAAHSLPDRFGVGGVLVPDHHESIAITLQIKRTVYLLR